MQMLNNLWTFLSTENTILINIISVIFLFIELPLTMKFFLALLNITSTKKQRIIYLACTIPIGIVCSLLIPKPFSNIITLVSAPIIILLVFKVNILIAMCAEFVSVICIIVLEIIITRLFLILFNCTYEMCAFIPIYKLTSTLTIYLIIFLIYKLILFFRFNIDITNTINKKNKHLILANLIFALIVMFMQIYLVVYYNDKLPLYIILINITSLLAYSGVSIFSIIKTMRLEKVKMDLEQEKLSYKTLQALHDNTRAFKHDFSNILAGIGGYVETNDMKGLKKYYTQLLQDCNQANNFSTLNPDVVNSPPVYAVLANKYYSADSLGIKISLESFIDFNRLHMDIYEFTRILGILMDNAIEAASECTKKLINVIIRNDLKQNRQLLIIENTYNNKDINIDKIDEKGFTTKSNNSGIGLWEVNKILKKHKNLAKFTTKNDEFFRQQIEIYNE